MIKKEARINLKLIFSPRKIIPSKVTNRGKVKVSKEAVEIGILLKPKTYRISPTAIQKTPAKIAKIKFLPVNAFKSFEK